MSARLPATSAAAPVASPVLPLAPVAAPRHVSPGKVVAVLMAACLAVLLTLITGLANVKLVVLGSATLLVTLSVMLHAGHFRRVVLFLLVVSQTYFRTYSLKGHYVLPPSFDPYWTVGDVFLLLILATAVWQRVFERRALPPRSSRMWLWWLPFWIWVIISSSNALRESWALFEVWRQGKVLLILLVLPLLIEDEGDLFTLLAALGVSVGLQSLMGVGQLLLGGGRELAGEDTLRATGTLGHPNQLSSYLEFIWPAFCLLIFAPRSVLGRWNRGMRRFCLFVTLASLGGIVAAQSRAVWFTAALQLIAIAVTLVFMHRAGLKQVIGTAVLGFTSLVVAALPFSGRIAGRLQGNLADSVEFRERFNRVAIAMILDHPILGGGPRQFPLRFASRKYSFYGSVAEFMPDFPVHNLYLLYLEEFGVFGFLAFLVFLCAMFYSYFLAFRRSGVFGRLVVLGFTFGFVGDLVHQLSEFTLSIDPNQFTWPILICIVTSPLLQRIGLDRAATGNSI